ncbi:MAG: hypothetical protein ACOCZT_01895, partial [Halanaerobiales bacterium]
LEVVNSCGSFELKTQYLESIDFQPTLRSNVRIKSIYGDRLSGILTSDRVELAGENSNYEFEREDILKIKFDNSPDDYFEYNPRFHFYLKNGDYITGNILGNFLEIDSRYSEDESIAPDKVEEMEFSANKGNYSSVDISFTDSQENIKAALKEKRLYVWSPIFTTENINHSYFELISRDKKDNYEYSQFQVDPREKDKEQIRSVLERFIEAYEIENIEFIEQRLDSDFNYDHRGRNPEKDRKSFLEWYEENSKELTDYEYHLDIKTYDLIEDNKYEILGTLTTRRNRIDHEYLAKFLLTRVDGHWKLLEFWYVE